MNTILWILQILSGLAFLASGAAKLTVPREQAAKRMSWVNHIPQPFIRLIGLAEVLGGIGLIVPWLVQPGTTAGALGILTPIAAICLGVIMVGAIVTHVRLNETGRGIPSVVLLIFVCIIAYGRFANLA